MPHPAVRPARIRVVGNPGAGKSTFSRALAERLGVAYLELDEICWGPDWTMRDPPEAQDALRRFLASEPARAGWVVDGNWDGLRQGIGDDADVTVWLDYSRAPRKPAAPGPGTQHSGVRLGKLSPASPTAAGTTAFGGSNDEGAYASPGSAPPGYRTARECRFAVRRQPIGVDTGTSGVSQ